MQETVDKDTTTEEKTDLDVRSDYLRETSNNTNSITSWSSLKNRYKNLWRTRLKKDGYKNGIRNSLLSGGVFAGLFLSVGPISPIFGSILYFYMGTITGVGISGYTNELDAFGGFHVGLISSTLLMGLMFLAGLLTSPLLALAAIPILISYVILLSASHGIYAAIGKEAKERNPPKLTKTRNR